jgi:tRNA threonylcarbamoyladenosine biosynthesis protein TsaB
MRLAIDTATSRLSVALGRTAADAVHEEVEGVRQHAAALLPAIERLLARAHVSRNAISSVVIADGPGSFTGLRVGAAVGKALVVATGVEFWTVPSLLTRAAAVSGPGCITVGVSDALRGQCYAGAWLWLPDGIETILPPEARTPAGLRTALPRPDAVVGELPPTTAAMLADWAPHLDLAHHVDARLMLDLVGRLGGALRVANPLAWEPDYGRPAEAQTLWEARHGRALPHPPGGGG